MLLVKNGVLRLPVAVALFPLLVLFIGCGESFEPVERYQAMSSGSGFACGLREDGTIKCWGANSAHGEKGLTRSPGGLYKAISAGYYGSCAIRTNGRLNCWGRVDGGEPRGRFVAVEMGEFSACAIREDRRLHCWGREDGGLLEYPDEEFVSVSATFLYACGVRTDGSASCWGELAGYKPRNAAGNPDASGNGVFPTPIIDA